MPSAFPNDNPSAIAEYTDYFKEYGPATWTVNGTTIGFPILEISEDGGNRIVRHERPRRDGAKLDDMGAKPVVFVFQAMFDDGLLILPDAELVLKEINGGQPLYPEVLNALLDSFAKHKTGDLFVPTRGKVRARAESYSRTEVATIRNHGRVNLTFVVDNEDSVDAAAFQPPAVSASAGAVAVVTEQEAEATGAWDGSIADLMELANNIEGLANAPGDFLNDVQAQAGALMAAVEKVIKVHTDTTKEGRDLLTDPESSKLAKHLEAMKEMAGQATQRSRRGAPGFQTRTYGARMSIFAVAAVEGADAATLMAINPQLEDMLDIPARTGVRVPV